MSWSVEFLEEAKKDIQKLERSATIQVLKRDSKGKPKSSPCSGRRIRKAVGK